MSDAINVTNMNIEKIFPISFSRPDAKDHILSEENLVSWIRSVSMSSSNSSNSKYSYVISENFENSIEFLIGGYYVRLTSTVLDELVTGNATDVYVCLECSETSGSLKVTPPDASNVDGEFRALKFYVDLEELPSTEADEAHWLHLATKVDRSWTVPPASKKWIIADYTPCSYYSMFCDGGEFE